MKLFALAIEALLTGSLAVLYPLSVWLLLAQRRLGSRRMLNIWMVVLMSLMFLLAVAHLAIDLARSLTAFVIHGSIAGGPEAYLLEISAPAYITKVVLFSILTLLGDGFMTYRIFVVWERNLLASGFSAVLVLATTGCYAMSRSGAQDATKVIFSREVNAFLSLCLATNVVILSLLIGRLLWYDHRMRSIERTGRKHSVHWEAMKTIIFCEGIYSVALIVNLAVYIGSIQLALITLDALPPLVGVSFTLIIVRVGLGDAVEGGATGPRARDRDGAVSSILFPAVESRSVISLESRHNEK
ncbi:hypothetical protein C8Q79DRAFT_915324 [Trametes meyenii]|nr:hypothetical protein C8Q79DRAFT_915324 [Trametes meyenii]